MKSRLSRLLAMLCGTALLAALAVGLTAVRQATPKATKDLTVGFIYIGPKDDYGYSQAHAQGAAAVKKMPASRSSRSRRSPRPTPSSRP